MARSRSGSNKSSRRRTLSSCRFVLAQWHSKVPPENRTPELLVNTLDKIAALPLPAEQKPTKEKQLDACLAIRLRISLLRAKREF
jgi:hypothetical protein